MGLNLNTENFSLNQGTPSGKTMGNPIGAKALNESLQSMLTATLNPEKLDGALQTIAKNKAAVSEYSTQISELATTEIKENFDTNGDEAIDPMEHSAAIQKRLGQVDDAESKLNYEIIKTAFLTLDINSDMKIDKEEYATYLASLDTNANAKIEKSEVKSFGGLVCGDKTNEDVKNFQNKNVFLNALLFKADNFKK